MKIPFLKRDLPKRGAVVVITLAAVAGVVTGREKPAIELVETKAPRIEAVADVQIDLEKLHRAEGSLPENDPFARRSFAPAPQPVAGAAAAPAAPEAPPLPFRYFGKLTEGGKTEVFVLHGDELISIAKGQKIAGNYRVDRITDEVIGFTYLPLNTRQNLGL